MGHSVTTLKVNTIEPAGSTLTLGASGDSVILADDLKSNTYKDAGGNTLFTSNGSGVLSSVNTDFGDSVKLLSTSTASNSASISFTLTNAYKEYQFAYYNITPATDGAEFEFDCSVSGTYGTTKTTMSFESWHDEGDSSTGIGVSHTSQRLAQATDEQILMINMGSGADESGSGIMSLYNPSSTSYVKHFHSRSQYYQQSNYSYDIPTAGYINTTSALDGIKFSMSTGNIASGKIKMYGIL